MIHPHQCPLVLSPAAALDAHQPVIRPLHLANHAKRVAECIKQARRAHHVGAVRKVPHARRIRRLRIELLPHIPRRQLLKRLRAQPEPGQHAVQPRQMDRPCGIRLHEQVCDRAPAVRRRNGRQRGNLDIVPFEPRDEVPRVEPAHAVREDVDGCSGGNGALDVCGEVLGAVGDGAGWRDRGRYDDCVVGEEGFADAVPVVDGGEDGEP